MHRFARCSTKVRDPSHAAPLYEWDAETSVDDPYTQLALLLDGEADMHTFTTTMEEARALDDRHVTGAGALAGRCVG